MRDGVREEGSEGWRVFRGDQGVGGLGRHENQGNQVRNRTAMERENH